ncbi:MAG: DUF3267 domain-containing protein [Bacteroidetes bacterium]|nr:DUF3267 domain-containing protein [Bacteroidota bacterium]
MANPTIKELQNKEQFELIAQLNHQQIKEFVIQQLLGGGKLVRIFMIYQVVMILLGIFFLTRSIVQTFQGYSEPFYYSLAAILFCFSLLIVIHELLHGVALKLIGAKQINFGGYLKKFIFYAEADQFVINRKQFAFIALTPLIVVKLLTLIGVLLFLNSPVIYFLIFVMSTHSLFCAGDIGLLSIFYKYRESEIYTYDVKAEKTSYYFMRKHN